MSKATVRPVRVYDYNDDLKVSVARTIGYRAKDGDSWRGPVRNVFREARDDARERNHAARQAKAKAKGSK